MKTPHGIIFLVLAAPFAGAQSNEAEAALGAARHLEEAEGNYPAAIEAYRKFVVRHGSNRALAAKALVRMGQCYEKLGSAESRKAYERVVREFADQPEAVAAARARLNGSASAPAKGIGLRHVWTNAGGDHMGHVSRDGRFFTSTDWSTGDLIAVNTATGGSRRVTSNRSRADGNAEFSVPSPDGRQIAYGWFRAGRGDLRVIHSDGSGMRVLYSDPASRYVELYDWSPDGKSLGVVIQKENHRKNELALVSVADGSVRVLKTMGYPHADGLRFSPDGRFLAYFAPQGSGARENDIFQISADGKIDVPLVRHAADDRLLGWSPDGQQVLFASNRTPVWSVWGIRVNGSSAQGEPRLIYRDLGARGGMGITARGSLYFTKPASSTEVYTAELDAATGRVVTAPKPVAGRFVGANLRAQWSPDGKSLAYQSGRSPTDETIVTVLSLESGEEKRLNPMLRNLLLGPWTNDGRSLRAVVTNPAGPPAHHQIDVQTGAVAPGFVPPATPDGKWTFRAAGDTILLRNRESGEEKSLYHRSGGGNPSFYGMQPSPDSSGLAVLVANRLVVVSIPDGETRELLSLTDPGEHLVLGAPGWTAGGRSVLFVKNTPKGRELWRAPRDGTAPHKIDLGLSGVSDLSVHPDGKRIAFTAGQDRTSEIWVLENFLGGLR
jgi:Tol biopolymer transport system component